MDSTTRADASAARYEAAEEAFLSGIRTESDRAHLTRLADEVASAAEAWNSDAYAAYHASSGDERVRLDHLTEQTELLHNLWVDIARAHHGLPAYRDG
ncbi:hypothetical protein AAII07_05005 [Microvirga sp. 0TCS3.31]